MAIVKDKVLQIRLDSELHRRFKSYADNQGLHVSIAIRHHMLRICEHYELQQARHAAQQKRELSKK